MFGYLNVWVCTFTLQTHHCHGGLSLSMDVWDSTAGCSFTEKFLVLQDDDAVSLTHIDESEFKHLGTANACFYLEIRKGSYLLHYIDQNTHLKQRRLVFSSILPAEDKPYAGWHVGL